MTLNMKMGELLDYPVMENGWYLIEASAGTGKTFTVCNLYLRLILERGLAPREILAVTFTEAATAELKERILSNLQNASAILSGEKEDDQVLAILRQTAESGLSEELIKARLKLAAASFDEAAIYTIHSFCQRMLTDNAFESKLAFETTLVTSEDDYIRQIVNDFWRENFYGLDKKLALETANAWGINKEALFKFGKKIADRKGILLEPEVTTTEDLHALMAKVRSELKKDPHGAFEAISMSKRAGKGPYLAYQHYVAVLVDDAEVENRTEAVLGCVSATNPKCVKDHPFIVACDLFAECAEQFVFLLKNKLKRKIEEQLESVKRRDQALSFNDMLNRLNEALQDGERGRRFAAQIRTKFKAAMVDEFQDTDSTQFSIFQNVFGVESLFYMIGDPKQSIYKFRGADIHAYLKASASTPANHRFTLTRNFRSSPDMLQAFHAVFGGYDHDVEMLDYPNHAFGLTQIPYVTVSAGERNKEYGFEENGVKVKNPLRIVDFVGSKTAVQWKICETVASEIVRLLDPVTAATLVSDKEKNPLKASDIAVLTRTNSEAAAIHRTLIARGVNATLQQAGNVFASVEAGELLKILRAVEDPRDANLRRALISPLIGLTAIEIGAFSTDEVNAQETYRRWGEFFRELRGKWQTQGFMAVFALLVDEDWRKIESGDVSNKMETSDIQATRVNILRAKDGERALTNLLHLGELIHQEASMKGLSIEGVLDWLSTEIADAASEKTLDKEEEAIDRELRLERDDEAVKIMTVHKSKGLEFPVVFCPFMFGKEVKSFSGDMEFSDGERMILDIGSEDHEDRKKNLVLPEEMREQLRLFYVALTRASRLCYLAWACPEKVDGRSSNPNKTGMGYLRQAAMPVDKMMEASLAGKVPESLAPWAKENGHSRVDHMKGATLISADHLTDSKNSTGLEFESEEMGDIDHSWRVMSFSGLAKSVYDAPDGITASRQTTEQEAQSDDPEFKEKEELERNDNRTSFLDFPGGTATGNLVHILFENLALGDDVDKPGFRAIRDNPNDPKLKDLIDGLLTGFGRVEGVPKPAGKTIDPVLDEFEANLKLREEQVYDMLRRSLTTILPGLEASLADTEYGKRLVEMEFFYPVMKHLNHDLIFNVIDNYPTEKATGLQGMMTGFVDLIYEHDGKYWILDWKTNNLGDQASDYESSNIITAMEEHDYRLQYYLYTVALHRMLRQRLPNYDYDIHFGGVHYLFVRGVGDDGSGIFFHRPNKKIVENLSALMGEK